MWLLLFYFLFSARSRVKGYLELYHAYVYETQRSIDDDDEDRNSRRSTDEPGWELVDNDHPNVETPAQVCI